MVSKPKPFDDIYGRGDRPNDQVGAWQYFNGSFKEAIDYSGDNKPFTTIGPDGGYSYETDKILKLESYYSATSGYVSIKLNNGWMGQFLVTSENNDFFEDASQSGTKDGANVTRDWRTIDGSQHDLAEYEYPTVWIQDDAEASDSRAMFVLDGDNGDYLSFDVDGESNDVAQARIHLDGENYISNTESSDELFIRMIWLRRWDPDYTSIDEIALGGGDTTIIPPPVTEDDLTTEDGVAIIINNNGGVIAADEVLEDASMIWILGIGFIVLVGLGLIKIKGE
jgi:hypothetical protein